MMMRGKLALLAIYNEDLPRFRLLWWNHGVGIISTGSTTNSRLQVRLQQVHWLLGYIAGTVRTCGQPSFLATASEYLYW